MFWKRTIGFIIFSIVGILLITVAGAVVYKAGFTHGAMAEFTIPEGSDVNIMPHGIFPYSHPFGPRLGFMGVFPFLLCLAGFFFLMMVFGAFRHLMFWKYAGKEHAYWKRRGPGRNWRGYPWGPGCDSEKDDQPESESGIPPADAGQSEK